MKRCFRFTCKFFFPFFFYCFDISIYFFIIYTLLFFSQSMSYIMRIWCMENEGNQNACTIFVHYLRHEAIDCTQFNISHRGVIAFPSFYFILVKVSWMTMYELYLTHQPYIYSWSIHIDIMLCICEYIFIFLIISISILWSDRILCESFVQLTEQCLIIISVFIEEFTIIYMHLLSHTTRWTK